MLELSTEELTNLLNKASKGRLGNEKAQEIKESAKNSFGVSFAKQTFSFQIKQIINQISFIESQLKELEKEITEKVSFFVEKMKLDIKFKLKERGK